MTNKTNLTKIDYRAKFSAFPNKMFFLNKLNKTASCLFCFKITKIPKSITKTKQKSKKSQKSKTKKQGKSNKTKIKKTQKQKPKIYQLKPPPILTFR